MRFYKPFFWRKKNFLSYLLYPFSLILIFLNSIRNNEKKIKFNIKTICVGNIYLGGTGKTSLCIEINKILSKKFKTTFIKKKYKNQIDEKRQLQKNGNVFFEKERTVSLGIAGDKNFKVALLDDGLQQKNIYYDLSIVCFNSTEGVGNNFTIPAGPLREKIDIIKNYDLAFIIGNYDNSNLFKKIRSFKKKTDIFRAKYIPTNLSKFNLKKKYLIFSGIGNPHEFEDTLKKNRFKIKEKFIFPDHHEYKDNEIEKINTLAKKKNLGIITTEKDFLRLKKKQKKNVNFIKIRLEIKNKVNLKRKIFNKL